MSNNTLILALSRSKSVQRITEILRHVIKSKGFEGVDVNTLPKIADRFSKEGFNIGSDDSPFFLPKRYENVIFISLISYDPLFGFSGAPTLILRNYMEEQMLLAFESRRDDLPNPGVDCPPLAVALSASEKLSAVSVELVTSSSGISGIYSGNICDAFRKAKEKLVSSTTYHVDQTKSAIVAGSNELDFSSLTTSLNLLWNALHVVQENGSIVLLAENQHGLGEGALQMFVEGKMKSQDLYKRGSYVPGLEHLIYIDNLRQQFDLGILSSLPQYYLKKLGFESYARGNDVLEKLLAKHGRKHKIVVSSSADLTLLMLRQQKLSLES
jgi:nickel-dependent lactate racemase